MQNHNHIPVYQNTMCVTLSTSETGFVNLFDDTPSIGASKISGKHGATFQKISVGNWSWRKHRYNLTVCTSAHAHTHTQTHISAHTHIHFVTDWSQYPRRRTTSSARITSCAGGRHNMPPPPANWSLTFLTLKVMSESLCDVGYLCANFRLPMPLCSRLRPDVRDRQTDVKRQTDVRRASSLNAPTLGAGA